MTTSTCSATTASARRSSMAPLVTEFRFDDDGSLVDLETPSRREFGNGNGNDNDIDLRSDVDEDQIEHLVQLASGDVVTVVGANAYQPEGPMTTFFSTGSSRGTIDSWSVRIASYRTNDIISIQRNAGVRAERHQHRPSLIAV